MYVQIFVYYIVNVKVTVNFTAVNSSLCSHSSHVLVHTKLALHNDVSIFTINFNIIVF